MSDFDIESFLNFDPPTHFCPNCNALESRSVAVYEDYNTAFDTWVKKCVICGYHGSEEHVRRHYIKFKDIVKHCEELARISKWFREEGLSTSRGQATPIPPMDALFLAFSAAEYFVHLITYGMVSQFFIGALKLLSQKAVVKGIVSGIDANQANELNSYFSESSKVELLHVEKTGDISIDRMHPHQKLIVVDGLLAFKGSANLTISGWQKAGKGRETVEIVTNTKEVVRLNNELFSSVWAEYSAKTKLKSSFENPF